MDNEEIAIKSIQMGAQDYILKNMINTEIIAKSIYYSLERSKITRELEIQKILGNRNEILQVERPTSHHLDGQQRHQEQQIGQHHEPHKTHLGIHLAKRLNVQHHRRRTEREVANQ